MRFRLFQLNISLNEKNLKLINEHLSMLIIPTVNCKVIPMVISHDQLSIKVSKGVNSFKIKNSH